jgi:RNA polymerase sigma factor (sigma-70 family)
VKRVDAEAEDLLIAPPDSGEDELLSVHEALDKLAALDSRKAEVVELRYFVGLSIKEIAEGLDISEPTAKRDWNYARAWLFREMRLS